MSEWRTIDSAPKDGSKFLALEEWSQYPAVIHWTTFSAEVKEETGADGFWEFSESLIGLTDGECRPVLWCPYPPLPAPKAEENG